MIERDGRSRRARICVYIYTDGRRDLTSAATLFLPLYVASSADDSPHSRRRPRRCALMIIDDGISFLRRCRRDFEARDAAIGAPPVSRI